ncbi:hypothetical protein FRC02_000802 [Tulasnella sp. 418]|nr:hypothetical protein FRC02_000802 [Tulasnella sp. 418]
MAEEFPYAEVVGLDLVPPVDITDMPLNCRFEIDDANLPMPHYTNCFNVVHCRSLEVGIKDFERLIYEIALMLRIGGIALISGGEMQLYGEDQKVLPNVPVGTPGFSWTNFYLQALLKAHEHRGSTSGEAKVSWNKWLANNPNFERTESFDILIPIGPWQKGPDGRLECVGELMRLNVLHLFQSGRSAIIQDGNSEEIVDYWIRSAIREQEDMTLKASVRWRFTCAKRKDVQWIPPDD